VIRLDPNQKLAILLVAIAIPTGVAVWDKLTTHGEPRGGYGSLLGMYDETPQSILGVDDVGRADELQRYALRQQEDLLKEQEKKAEADTIRRVKIASVIGTSPGAMPRDEDLEALQRDDLGTVTSTDGEVEVDFTDATDVSTMVTDAWGVQPDGQWMDPSSHVRAHLTGDGLGVHLAWRRFSTPDQVIAALDLDGPTASLGQLDPLGWSDAPMYLESLADSASGAPAHLLVHTNAPGERDAMLAALATALGSATTERDGTQMWRHGKFVIRATAPPEGVVIDVTRARR
jgi:hypothetical protein